PTFSVIACVDEATGGPKCIEGPHGETLCPSVVNVDAGGNIIVGAPASRRLVSQADRTLDSIKRLLGRGADDVRAELKRGALRLDPESQDAVRVCLGDRLCTPAELSAFLVGE